MKMIGRRDQSPVEYPPVRKQPNWQYGTNEPIEGEYHPLPYSSNGPGRSRGGTIFNIPSGVVYLFIAVAVLLVVVRSLAAMGYFDSNSWMNSGREAVEQTQTQSEQPPASEAGQQVPVVSENNSAGGSVCSSEAWIGITSRLLQYVDMPISEAKFGLPPTVSKNDAPACLVDICVNVTLYPDENAVDCILR